MRLHPAGIIPIIVIIAAELLIIWLVNLIFPSQTFFHYFLYTIGIIFTFLVIRFFRRPNRSAPASISEVICPADGTVVAIEEIENADFFNDRRIQVSVFMSPLNVHINWYPISGEIIHSLYHKGKYYPAYAPKASSENERQATVIRDDRNREVMMIQIAGVMARRVLSNARQGNYVFKAEEAGLIKFGSRVDLILPLEAKVEVELKQKVRACDTVIARFED